MISNDAAETKTRKLYRLIVVGILIVLVLASTPFSAAADEGWASWYGEPFHGRTMYGGQVFDMYDPTTTAANIFPIGTWLKVTNPLNGHTVVVQVRDRGGFSHAVDLSFAAFQALDNPNKMMIRITYQVVSGPDGTEPAPTAAKTVPPAPAAAAPKTVAPAPAPAAAKAPVSAPAAPPSSYTIEKGDTLNSVSRRFGLDPAALAKWNRITDPNRIVIGQLLTFVAPAPAPAEPSSRGSDESARAQDSTGSHTVSQGETMWDLAAKYGTTPKRLVELNGLNNPDAIVIGQRLRVSEVDSSRKPQDSAGTHTVSPGDTMWALATKYGSTPERLAELNDLSDPNAIVIGQHLRLPESDDNSIPAPAVPAAKQRYTVQPGDSIYSIAAQAGVSEDDLAAVNNIANPHLIQIGQVLDLP